MLLSLLVAATPIPEPSLGDQVLPVIIGALVALAGSVFVQFWLIPRVDTRKRREHRWEEDVLALGQLLTFEYPSLIYKFRVGLHAHGEVAEAECKLEEEEWSEAHVQVHEPLRATHQVLQALLARRDWISDRVASLAPHNRVLQEFGELSRRHRERYLEFVRLEWEPEAFDGTGPTRDEINAAGDAFDDATDEMVSALKALLAGPPPRDPAIRKRSARDGEQVSDRASIAQRVETWWRDLRESRSRLDDVSE